MRARKSSLSYISSRNIGNSLEFIASIRFNNYYIPEIIKLKQHEKKTPIIIMILLLAVPNSVFAATSFILQAKAEGNVVILSHTIYQTYGSAPF